MKLIWQYLKFNIAAAMEYRVTFLIQTLGMVLNNAAFIFFWWILFENINTIGGYGFTDVMLLWSFCSASFGLCFIIFGNLSQLSRLILEGELDSFLLQPKDVLLNVLCSRSQISAWGDLLYGGLLFVMTMHGQLTLATFALFLLFVMTSAVIFSSVLIIAHSLTFYFGDFTAVANLVTEFMITFSIYPEGIFSQGLRMVLYSVLPIGFMAYLPARNILAPSGPLVVLILGASIFWAGLAYWVFYRGLKRYESGNLMGVKL